MRGCECHQHRSHPAQPGPPSGLADLQQTTDAGATAALERRWSQPSGRQLVWDKTYRRCKKRRQQLLREMVEASPHAWMDSRSQTYLIPIDDLHTSALTPG